MTHMHDIISPSFVLFFQINNYDSLISVFTAPPTQA